MSETKSLDVTHELQQLSSSLNQELMQIAKFAATSELFSNSSQDVEMSIPDVDMWFCDLQFKYDKNKEKEVFVIQEEIKNEFAQYSCRYAVISMVTAFEVFLNQLLWLAKTCRICSERTTIKVEEFFQLRDWAQDKARHCSVDGLIKAIGEQLNADIEQKSIEWFRSIYRIRKCLLHRRGLVGKHDVEKDGELKLRWQKPQLTVNGEPAEIRGGLMIEKDALLGIQFVETERCLKVNDELCLTPGDCQEIAFSLYRCASDIAKSFSDAARNLLK